MDRNMEYLSTGTGPEHSDPSSNFNSGSMVRLDPNMYFLKKNFLHRFKHIYELDTLIFNNSSNGNKN